MAFNCQLFSTSNETGSLSPACIEHANATVGEIFGSLVPNCDSGAWSSTDEIWLAAFYLHIIIFGIIFLIIGLACLIFLSKRHLAQRFKTKTFIAIDLALAILGFSKVFFYILDPYGISGYCTHMACILTSRLLFAVGFPSLTAAYTLVFLTLWYSARMKLGRSCIQKWRIIIPLCFIHYFVAIIFELVGAFGNSYYILFLLISCEVLFTTWGLVVCATFLVGGIRLLKSVHTSARESSIVSRDVVLTESQTKDGRKMYTREQSTMKLRPKRQHKQALRKVAIITYSSAGLGALYSIFGIIQIVMLCMLLFGECEEDGGVSQNSNLWLSLKYISSLIEVLLAILLIYSINDIRPLYLFFKQKLQCIIHCGHVRDSPNFEDKDNIKKDKIFHYTSSIKNTSSRSSSPVHTYLTTNGSPLSPQRELIKQDSKGSILGNIIIADQNGGLNHTTITKNTIKVDTEVIPNNNNSNNKNKLPGRLSPSLPPSPLCIRHISPTQNVQTTCNDNISTPQYIDVSPDRCTGQVELVLKAPLSSDEEEEERESKDKKEESNVLTLTSPEPTTQVTHDETNNQDLHTTAQPERDNNDITYTSKPEPPTTQATQDLHTSDTTTQALPSRNGKNRVTFSKQLPKSSKSHNTSNSGEQSD